MIRLSDVVKEYESGTTALKGISLRIEDGEFVFLVGPSGSGKSTLVKLLMGIETPDAGEILLDGKDISKLSIAERAGAGIGYAFQQPPRFKGMTIRKLLSLAAGEPLNEEKCCALLSSVGLCAGEYIDRQADDTLSGGVLKLPLCWRTPIRYACLTSRKRALTSGVFPC